MRSEKKKKKSITLMWKHLKISKLLAAYSAPSMSSHKLTVYRDRSHFVIQVIHTAKQLNHS